MLSIYGFKDYRSYLKQYYLEKKNSTAGFSYAQFSRETDLSSPNYLKLIMDGQRDLTISMLHQFAEALALTSDETEYFEAMVHENQAKSKRVKTYYQKRMARILGDRQTPAKKGKAASFSTEWFFPAVALACDGTAPDRCTERAVQMVGVSPAEAERAIEILMREGVLIVETGLCRLSGEHLMLLDDQSRNQAQKRYLAQQLKLSQLALASNYEKEGKFVSHTFSVAQNRSSYYVGKVYDFLEKISQESNNDPAEELLQLNIQLFKPQTLAKAPGLQKSLRSPQ